MKTRIFSVTMMMFFALFMLCGTTSAKGKEIRFASSLENAADPTMKLEPWMVNDFIWSRSRGFDLSTEEDEFLGIEEWMTNSALWEMTITETEEALTLEDWMLNDTLWVANRFASTTENDRELKIESWMTDATIWN
jgi:hypothetical protein